jgi:lipopolysaccharide/colanic/teichoic acid biosynthesis glycosyltransferase
MAQDISSAEAAERALPLAGWPSSNGMVASQAAVVIDLPERDRRLYPRVVKPGIDTVGAAVLLILALPLMAALAVAVRTALGAGVIYRQTRVSRGGRAFTIYKFRTMLPDRRRADLPYDGPERRVCHKADNDPRHTAFGRFLRKYSLDELPQLWNVLLGDMSLVGPRPELLEVVDRYEPWQHQRHGVKPGLTGLWQVTCRGKGLAHHNVDVDLDYISGLSLLTDLKILALTLPVALFGSSGK